MKMCFPSFKTLCAKNFSESLFIVYKHSYPNKLILPPKVFKINLFPSIVQALINPFLLQSFLIYPFLIQDSFWTATIVTNFPKTQI